jgi:hypothetical protein
MKKLAALLGLSVVLVSSIAAAAGWSGASRITQFEIDGISDIPGFAVYLGFSSMPNNRPACATASQGIIVGNLDHVKNVSNLALAAFLGGKTVKVYWTSTCFNGTFGQIERISAQ